MAAYHETALLYNLKDTDIGRQLKLILIKMKVRIRMVEASQYLQPIGFLAGIKDMDCLLYTSISYCSPHLTAIRSRT